MNYPRIDPIFVDFGVFTVHWYGALYLVAFVVFYLLGKHRLTKGGQEVTADEFLDMLFYCILGVVVGGRVGFALLYELDFFLANPLWIFKLWEGGMSFHGGLLGVIVAVFFWSRVRGKRFIAVTDFIAPLVPLGIGLGRIGNFINAELPGRVTESALGVHFPCSSVSRINIFCIGEYEEQLRHVSSLYQAGAEGLVLFGVIWLYSGSHRPIGYVSGLFLICSGLVRFVTEMFRVPDISVGYIAFEWLTMGQLLSILVISIGLVLMSSLSSNWLKRDEVS